MSELRLIAIDGDLSRAIGRSVAELEAVCGASAGNNAGTIGAVVARTLALLERLPRDRKWGGYLTADPALGLIVGTCGFKHGPEGDGRVEIAYFTFPEFEGQGYATAMAARLCELAAADPVVREIIAHTLPERNASTRILEKTGFELVGEIVDPEDGPVWRWLYRGAG